MSDPSPQLVYDVEKVDQSIPYDTSTGFPTGGPMEIETSVSHPSSLNGLSITSIILTTCGIGLGLAAGAYATASHQQVDFKRQEVARVMAQMFGFLGIAAFATSIPLLACGATQYQNKRGSKGLPVVMTIAWIAYGLGMMDALILLASSVLSLDIVQPIWVYLAVLYNVIPFLIMMVHAEYSRRGFVGI